MEQTKDFIKTDEPMMEPNQCGKSKEPMREVHEEDVVRCEGPMTVDEDDADKLSTPPRICSRGDQKCQAVSRMDQVAGIGTPFRKKRVARANFFEPTWNHNAIYEQQGSQIMKEAGIYAEFWRVRIEPKTKVLLKSVLDDVRRVVGKPLFVTFIVLRDQDQRRRRPAGLFDEESVGLACTTVSALETASHEDFANDIRFEVSVFKSGDDGAIKFSGSFGPGGAVSRFMMRKSTRLIFMRHWEFSTDDFKHMREGAKCLARKLPKLAKATIKNMQELLIKPC